MSSHTVSSVQGSIARPDGSEGRIARIAELKRSGTPIVMVTAYDVAGARACDAAGVDIILVGDSVAMVVLGYDDTLQVTVADIAHHTAAVARSGSPRRTWRCRRMWRCGTVSTPCASAGKTGRCMTVSRVLAGARQ